MKPTRPPTLPIEDFTFLCVECHPGRGKNNSRYERRSSKQLSKAYKRYQEAVNIAWLLAGQPRFHQGPVGVEIVAYWDRIRTFDDGYQTAMADVDAIDKATLDALDPSHGGCECFDSDMRVRPLVLDKDVDKENPRVEIYIWRPT